MNYLQKRVKENVGIELTYEPNVIDKFILEGVKDESEFGARPIKRFIASSIENKIVEKILSGSDKFKKLSIAYNKKEGLIIS